VNAPRQGGALDKEKSTISCQIGGRSLLFFRNVDWLGWRFPQARRDQGFGARTVKWLVKK
jgi:hypothetical protein